MQNFSLCRHAGIVSDMKFPSTRVMALALTAWILGGCQRGDPQSAAAAAVDTPPQVSMGSYRAVLSVPGGGLPVGLDLERAGAATVGYLVNGPGRVKLDEVTVTGPHLEIRMP